MKPYLLSILILLVITISMILIMLFNQTNQTATARAKSSEIFYFNDLLQYTIANESIEICNPLVYKGIDTVNKCSFYDLIRSKILVFRFSGEACNACIDFAMDGLKKRFPDFATNDRIIIIGSNINERIKENYYGKPVISFYTGNLGIPIEEYNIPFIFIADDVHPSTPVCP